jgi:hypothetical protein
MGLHFFLSARGHAWPALDERLVTVRAALKGNPSPLSSVKNAKANVYEWLWWAADLAVPAEPTFQTAEARRVALAAWQGRRAAGAPQGLKLEIKLQASRVISATPFMIPDWPLPFYSYLHIRCV